MANTIITKDLLQKEVIRVRDQKTVFLPYVNQDYTGQLRQAGDTVSVQTLPTLNFASGTAGADITATDFTITSENLVIDQVEQLLVRLTEKEITQSNLSLVEKVGGRIAEAEGRLIDDAIRDQILVTQVADIPAANKLNSGAPATITKTNVYEKITDLSEALDNQNVGDNMRILFVAPFVKKFLKQSAILDASDLGLETRYKGYIGMIDNVKVVTTTALNASKEMIMMEANAVNMVIQLDQFKITEAEKGFSRNVLAEDIYGLKIFGENAKAIAIQYVA